MSTTTTTTETIAKDQRPRDATTTQEWRLEHHIIDKVHPFRRKPRKPIPVFSKAAPIPILTQWSCHRFILIHALWPALVQAIYLKITSASHMPWWACLAMYTFAYFNMMLREASKLHHVGKKVGFLDGDKHPRDRVAEDGARKVLTTVAFFAFVRPCLTCIVAGWDGVTSLPAFTRWLPLELFLYSIVLDLWFYTYHRACHEVGFLWKFHRTHHLTKHPIPLLASFSDMEQEVLEVIVIPLLTYVTLKFGLCLPMNFHEWWICQAYILFEEVMGHSGLRVYAITPSLASIVLQYFDCELVIEDHDLHHRHGWRKSCNYGKQTRLWDRIFSTTGPRLESINIDPSVKLDMALM